MESFLKKVISGKVDADSHRYFVRFGKGRFNKRFPISLDRGKKIKVKAGFELANDLVKFVKENKNLNFSGKVLTKEKVSGLEGRKKAGVFVYEITESKIDEFGNAYYYLLDVNDSEIVLKIKKSLPKPGKNEEKIDDKFCTLEIDPKYWLALKEVFFWDLPECKKAKIEHQLIINGIQLPAGEDDPVKIRELARRQGILVRKIIADKKETAKEYKLDA